MFKVAKSLPPILAASPNAGGLFCLIGGRSHLVRRESVTGLAADGQALYCVIQEGGANEIRRTTRSGSTVVRLADERLDLHDLFVDGGDLYAVYTETNEVVRLDDRFRIVERWRSPGEVDAVHVNCIAMLDGRLLATLFGQFTSHREYKGRTKRAGQVIDVKTGEVLIQGLSQPHSILADQGLLYLCNSEKGELLVYRNYKRIGKVDFGRYTRGLAVDDRHVYVGLSASRNVETEDGASAEVVVLDRGALAEQGRIPLPCKEVYALLPMADEALLQSVVVGLGEDLDNCNKELAATRGPMEQLASQAAEARAAQAQQASALAGLNEARAQLEARLGALQELLNEKDARLAEVAGQIQQRDGWLIELRTHADALTSLRGELEGRLNQLQLEAGILRSKLSAREEQLDGLQRSMAEKVQQLADSAARIAGQESALLDLRARLDALVSQRSDVEVRIRETAAEADALRSDISSRDGQLQEYRGRIESLVSQRDDLGGQLQELRGRFESLASQRDDLDVQLQSSATEADALRRDVSTRDEQLQGLRQALAQRDQQLAESRMQSADKANAVAELEVRMEALAGLRTNLEGRVKALEGEAETLRQQAHARAEHNESLQKLVREYEARISGLTGELEQNAEELAGLASALAAVTARVEQGEERLALAQAEAAQKESEFGAILEAANSRVEQHEAALAESRQALRLSEMRLQDTRILADFRRAELQTLLASKSWKVTAPLRWFRRGFKGSPFDPVTAGHGAPKTETRRLEIEPAEQGSHAGVKGGTALQVDVCSASPPAPEAGIRDVYLDRLFSPVGHDESDEYVGRTTAPPPAPWQLRAKLIAFYLPQFHPFPENDAWWGAGFTEWTNVTKAVPQFLGHDQPQLPGGLGFYDLRVPETLRAQVELARQYGVHGFCFHYYWFGGKRLLERPLDLFIENKDIDFPFCLCWANENWTRRWDGQDSEILMAQDHTPENDLAFIRDLVPYLKDPRYIRIDGKPLVTVYRPSILPDCRSTLVRWREYCREIGIGEIFLAMVQFDVHDPSEYGFDAALEFPPHKLAAGLGAINHTLDIVNPRYEGHVVHYQSIVDRAKELPKPDYPMVRGVFPGWDNEARRPGRGYTFAFSTPDRYRDWLEFAVTYAEENPVGGEKMVMVNAWNEWAEGAHLEPDRRFGYSYLDATRDVVVRKPHGSKVIVVSHDAHPHGAQYLALNLVRELQRIGCEVEVLLLGGGPLRDQFAEACRIHEVDGRDAAAISALALSLVHDGFDLVIANTAVSGRVVRHFKKCGARVVSLIHELPGVIREYGLQGELQDLADFADVIVAPSVAVVQGLAQFIDTTRLGDALQIRPQGLFTRSRYRAAATNDTARSELRKKLGIPSDSRVVLTVGYADKRKGVDLLARVAGILGKRRDDLHFVWVGHHDISVQQEINSLLEGNGMAQRFHFPGLDFDTDDYYAGADIFALASREDPFPSVVLESLSVRTPVVAFKGTGGGADLVEQRGGRVVEAFDVEAYASAIEELLNDEPSRMSLGRAGRETVDRDYSFRAYAMDLLAHGGANVPRVSVVLPNYNYAHYMRERLESIAGQTLPLYEIIVLDDCSTDASVETLGRLSGQIHPEPQIVQNERNSGSVFRQWLRGVERARGDFVWIAEADDLSSPRFLEEVVGAMQRDASIVMSYCQSRQIDETGKVLAENYLAYTEELCRDRWLGEYVADGSKEVEVGLAVKNFFPNVSAVVFRREPLLDVLQENIEEILRFRVAGDWITYLHLLKKGRVAYVPRSHNSHRRHSSSVTLDFDKSAHLREIRTAHARARELFDVPPGLRSSQNAYIASVANHFGLDHHEVPGSD